MSTKVHDTPDDRQILPGDEAIERIRDALSQIRFGSIALTIHDTKLVQIDVTEKRRFND